MSGLPARQTNTILYCKHFARTVDFYRRALGLPVTLEREWFVEFALCDGARLSIADEARARVKSAAGAGITISLQVESADRTWQDLRARGLEPQPVREHPWGARAFYLFDPEGHRFEIWSCSTPPGAGQVASHPA